jgi:hypothetical protein
MPEHIIDQLLHHPVDSNGGIGFYGGIFQSAGLIG